MKQLLTGFLAAGSLAVATACSTIPQSTSGADYLAGYSFQGPVQSSTNLDREVRQIAAVEPNLRFPARIGLARVDSRGRLMSVPAEEGYMWQDAAAELGPEFGSFIPISPLIAASVARSSQGVSTRSEAMANIRRGAARQHIDYVLIYEVTTTDERRANILALTDATLLGLFILPSRGIEVEAVSSALLMDVRNGYPYATITEYAEKSGLARGARKRARTDELSDAASLNAVEALIDETGTFLRGFAEEQTAAIEPASSQIAQ